jgi:putative tryptophan/tyrosine transport system substrate-binding protein
MSSTLASPLRFLWTGLVLVCALLSSSADAAPAPGVHRIGYLHPGSAALAPIRLDPLRQGLRELGYVEGRNLVLEARWGEGNFERLGAQAAELVQLKVAIIVTGGAAAAQAARGATSTVPIVMVDPGDPVRTNLIASLSQPGGNMTGLSSATPDLAAKQLQLLKETVPGLTRVGFLSNPGAPAGALALGETERAAAMLGVKVQPIELRKAEELDDAFTVLARAQAKGLIVFADPLTFTLRQRIVQTAAHRGLPTVSGSREFVDAGAMMSYGPSFPEMFRQAAMYVDKLLHGAKAAELPVEQPTRFELVIDMKAARALGVTFPQSILMRADTVIE